DDQGGERDQQDEHGQMAQPAGCSVDEVGKEGRRRPAPRESASPAVAEDIRGDERRNHEQPEESPRRPERHRPLRRKAARLRSQSPEVVSTVWRTPSDESAEARSRRSASAASAKRLRRRSLRVSTRTWRPVSASTSQSSPALTSCCSRGSRISTATTSCRAASWSIGLCQSRGPRKSETITTRER